MIYIEDLLEVIPQTRSVIPFRDRVLCGKVRVGSFDSLNIFHVYPFLLSLYELAPELFQAMTLDFRRGHTLEAALL